jgi:hypothetical protein
MHNLYTSVSSSKWGSSTAVTSCPRYEALSYEWGDPNGKPQTILLNGQPFEIRDNLYQALQSMRPYIPGVPMWIDAICINQKDRHERNHQVRMMSVIYEEAARVRVWLGVCTVSDEEACVLIQKIARADILRISPKGTWKLGDVTRFLKLMKYSYTRATDPENHRGGRVMSLWDDVDSNWDERASLKPKDYSIDMWEQIYFPRHWDSKVWWFEAWNYDSRDLEGRIESSGQHF